MGLPHTFGALTTAQMSFLDDNDQALGALTTLQTTASGTNAFTLTPAANAPTVAAYGLPNPVRFGFVAGSTSTGAVTARIGSLTFLKVFLPSGVQANTGDISSGFYYEVVFISSLDSGNGGWQIVSALPGAGSTPASSGAAKGLVVVNDAGTPSTKIDITASKATLITSSGSPIFVTGVSVTIDLTTTGANGMDVGSRPTSAWVYLWLISNGSVVAGIASATSPTAGSFSPVPSGYIYSTYVGAMFLDGSQNLLRSKQLGQIAQYTVTATTNTATLPLIDHGTKGTFSGTSPTLASVSITSFVPLTASEIRINVASSFGANAAASTIVAPSTSYGGANNGPAGSNGLVWPAFINSASAGSDNRMVSILLEGTTIAWAGNGAGSGIACAGWTDYYAAC